MASGVNKVILIGNLCKDPEVRYGQSGKAVCNLRLACNERRKDGDGWKDHAEFIDVVTFDKTAENAGQYLSKGRQVYVEGKLQTRTYKDKDGNERRATEVVADRVVFVGGGGGDRPAGGASSAKGQAPPPDAGFVDDDLPF